MQLRAKNTVEDPWKVLGVEQGASMQEIKRAYRRRALKDHPDVNKAPDAKEKWQELSQAYEILSDPQKQKLWEEAKRQSAAGGRRSSGWGGSWRDAPKGPRQREQDAKYDAGGDSFGSIFGDLLEGLGREVGGATGPVGGARKVGGYVLEELLDFLDGTWDDDTTDQLKFAREELASLEQLDKSVREETATWEKQVESAKAQGNPDTEMDAMRKVFEARDRRKSIRRRLLRAEENVEYLEKAVFEYQARKRKGSAQGAQGSQAEGPGTYTVQYDQTKVSSTLELSNQIVGTLSKGAKIEIVEVVERPQDKRIRGRLTSPAGWISLVNTESGYRWAERDAGQQGGGSASSRSGSSSSAGSSSYARSPPKPDFDADAALRQLKDSKSSPR